MSEYQYYEFAAVDCPLSPQQQAELRARSSRATITAGSFINEYHWGDLDGDPLDWMRRYFDAQVYSASRGNSQLLLRLPATSIDRALLDAFVQPPAGGAWPNSPPAFEASFVDDYCLLGWTFNDEGGYCKRFWNHSDGPGWMARLLPLRDELLRGDTRPLYLGWLARLCAGQLGDDDIEPPVPAGLTTLTPAQQALVEFIELDPDWLNAAAVASPAEALPAGPEHDIWLAGQQEPALMEHTRLLLEGRGQEAERRVRQSFLSWQAGRRTGQPDEPRRRVADIALGVTAARGQRLEREQQARAAAEAEQRARRNTQLEQLTKEPQRVWQNIDALLKRGSGSTYDQALRLTQDLAEALHNAGNASDFRAGLVRLLGTHGKRPAWVARLEKAGLLAS